ncbi:MAG: (d)CMP kinase [Desulfomonilaceae bacterium]|nr:(d)CMP kinase [Desulfomonilaceae bacterium]
METGISSCRAKDTTVIAIDGPAGSGKSTVARLTAHRLGFFLLDTGALYRALALHLMRHGITDSAGPVDPEVLNSVNLRVEPAVGAMQVFLDGEDVTADIRSEKVGDAASRYSSRPEVRHTLVGLQRDLGTRWNLVAEGRDMGSVVFPEAKVKIFLTADLEVRARRRYLELRDKGERPAFDDVLADMRDRDVRDETRSVSPLVQAWDATRLDTTDLTPDQVVEQIIQYIKESCADASPVS